MGIFDLFTTPKEKAAKEILSKKPAQLMHTSTTFPDKIYSIRPSFKKDTKEYIVFATDDEKIAALYTLQPFYSFTFGNKERGIIILGSDHDLIKLDSKVAYTYYVDSDKFNPEISETGFYDHVWLANEEILVRKDIPPKKVVFNDVLRLGIQVFWIKDKTTLLEIDKQLANENAVTGDQKLEFLINQTNWKPDRVMYMNAYRKICPAIQTDKGWAVNYNMQVSNPVKVENTNQISSADPKSRTQPNINHSYHNNAQNNKINITPTHSNSAVRNTNNQKTFRKSS